MQAISRIAILVSALLVLPIAAQAQDQVTRYTDMQDGRQLIVHTGMPAPDNYGAKPAFGQLDRDHDGTISREEAEAFPPLGNDFDFVSQYAGRISARQYAQWDYR